MKRREPEQLNKPASEEYRLEDILREFGSQTETGGVSDDTAVLPKLDGVKVAAPKKKQPPPVPVSGDTQRLPSLAELQKAGARLSPPAEKPSEAERRTGEAPQKADAPSPAPPKPLIRPVAPPPTPRALLADRLHGLWWLRLRVGITGVLALVGLLLLLYREHAPSVSATSLSAISVGLLALTLLLSPEVFVRAARDLFRLRMGLFVPSVAAAVLSVVQSVLDREGASYCAPVSLLFFFLMLSVAYERSALVHTLRTVASFDAPMGIFDTPQLLSGADSLRRDVGDTVDFLQRLTQTDTPQTLLRIYAWLLFPLTGGLAYLLSRITDIDFPLAWLLHLLGGIPFCGMLSYVRPFSALSKRLSAFGGALCGWHSARVFGGKHTIILRDGDLFPPGTISTNGMKLYGANKPARVIAYTLAALDTAKSPLCGIFETLLQAQYGRHFRATAYRFYNGGIGIEVAGDVVLVGSLGFMREMGVHMPDGTRVRQAIYTSVNGELAGIFALRYQPNASTRAGLHDLLANRRISVVLATRDFLVTPELLAAKYDLDTQTLRFPAFAERLRLSAGESGEAASQGALIAKDTFGAFASTVAAGRSLRTASLLSVWMSLLSGVLGVALCTLMIAWNAPVTPLHVAAFQLLWALAVSFVSRIVLKW